MRLPSLIEEYKKCEEALREAIRTERIASVRECDIRMNWIRRVIREFDAKTARDRLLQTEFFLTPISQAADIHPTNSLFDDLRTIIRRYVGAGAGPGKPRQTVRAPVVPRVDIAAIVTRSRLQAEAIEAIERTDLRVSVIDRDMRYTYTSPANARFHDRPSDEIVGRHVSELIGTERFEKRAKAYFEKCFDGEDQCYYFYLESERDGIHLLECRMLSAHDNDDVPNSAIVLLRDLTNAIIDPIASAEANRI
ncbi:MAG: PAS domain-containing protein [Oricola sp.]